MFSFKTKFGLPQSFELSNQDVEYVTGPYTVNTVDVARLSFSELGFGSLTPVSRILAASDLDGDGTSELIVSFEGFTDGGSTPSDTETQLVILNLDGTSYQGISQLPSRVHEREAIIADFNNDGIEDVFIASTGLDG